MQISLSDRVPVTAFWESRLAPDELIRASQQDPSLFPAASSRIANLDVNMRNGALAWQEGAQIVLAHVGPTSGFPSATIPTIVTNVGEILLDLPTDPRLLAIKMAQIGVGVAMAATAAIPIVGAVVNAIGAVAQWLLALAAKPREEVAAILPPLQDYSEENDTWVVNNQVLPASATFDWTGLFLPRFRGDWKAHGREGKAVACMGATYGGGLGYMPGTQRITSMINIYWLRRGHAAEVSPEINASHTDVGGYYPGATQLTTALQEQAAKVQTQLYNIDTDRILSAWEEYVEGAFVLAKGIYERKQWAVAGTPLAEQSLEQNRVFAKHLVAPLLIGPDGKIDLLTTYWTPDMGIPDNTVLRIIRKWCDRIRRRQWNNLGRIVGAAYTMPSQACFHNPQMMQKLVGMRKLLLDHRAVHDVDLRDVIDPEYREPLFDRTVRETLVAPSDDPKRPNAPIDPDVGKDPPPPGLWGGVPFGGGGGGGIAKVLVLGAAAAGAFVLARRRRWI